MKMEQNENKSLCNLEKRDLSLSGSEVSLATPLERELTNPSMIDVCYERLCSRLIGFMRMTRKSFVSACLCVNMGMNQFFCVCVSSFPVVVEARGLNDIGAEKGGNFILIWF